MTWTGANTSNRRPPPKESTEVPPRLVFSADHATVLSRLGQQCSKDNHFVGAPAPREIAEAAYGLRLDDKLRKATVERLLPCIVDARPLPRALVAASVRRACNRAGMEKWEWERCLGIACALVRGS